MSGQHFRAGVVAVVTREDGDVLAFERSDPRGQWQLPQGGLEARERPVDAAWRELREEAGLGPGDVRLVHEHPHWVTYEWPAALWMRRNGDLRIGQTQRWFFFEPTGKTLRPVPDGDEFVAMRWVTPAWLIHHVRAFRRPAYQLVLGDGATDE